ncbi:MAG: hypothetical protein ABEJ77_06815 [Halanaeroarchaeum sp.]
MDATPARTHPIWRVLGGMVLGYGIALVAVFVLLFLLPYAVFLWA